MLSTLLMPEIVEYLDTVGAARVRCRARRTALRAFIRSTLAFVVPHYSSGENAPTAAVCCNACRTCVQTNLIGLALGAITAAHAIVTRRIKPS